MFWILCIVVQLGRAKGLLLEDCDAYIAKLLKQFQINATAAIIQLSPYIVMSGKSAMDLGFIKGCQQMNHTNFTTIQVNTPLLQDPILTLTAYQGFCFTDKCPASWMNNNKDLIISIINKTIINIPSNANIDFVEFEEAQGQNWWPIVIFSGGTAILLYVGMAWNVRGWLSNCFERLGRADYIEQDPEQSVSFRLSFSNKIGNLFTPEGSEIPSQVSWLFIISTPILAIGQEFIFRNYASLNLLSHQDWFPTFMSFLSLIAFYLPDILLLAAGMTLQKPSRRLAFTVPLYYFSLFLLLSIKGLWYESNPIWYVYNSLECHWVEEFFLMGGGCPWIGFYLRTQIIGIVIAVILGMVAKKVGFRLSFLLCSLSVLGSLIPIFIQSHLFPNDFSSLHNPKLYSSLSNTSNHLFFYLLGLFLSMIKASFPRNINRVVESSIVRLIGVILFCAGIVLVGIAPWQWGEAGLEFALARIFVAILAMGLMVRCFRNDELKEKGILFKLAEIAVPMVMVIPGVIALSVMAVQGMAYTTSLLVIESAFGSLGISLILGPLAYLLTDLRAGLPKQTQELMI